MPARDDMLRDGVGTAPPDLPPNVAANADANRCEKQIAGRLAKGIGNVQKLLARCELDSTGLLGCLFEGGRPGLSRGLGVGHRHDAGRRDVRHPALAGW